MIAMAELVVRAIEKADIPHIVRILEDSQWINDLDKNKAKQISYLEGSFEIYSGNGTSKAYVAVLDGQIVGYVAFHDILYYFLSGPEVYVSELFVLTEYRNKNIGNSLVNKVKEYARSIQAERLMLITGRGRESYKRQFYKKNGWQERESLSNFIFNINKPVVR